MMRRRGFGILALAVLLALSVSAAAVGEKGVLIPVQPGESIPPGARFEVVLRQAQDEAEVGRGMATEQNGYVAFIPLEPYPEEEKEYTVQVTSLPAPGEEGFFTSYTRSTSYTVTPMIPQTANPTCGHTVDNSTERAFHGGSGTQADPYRIYSAQDLQHIKQHLTGQYFFQVTDIDMADYGNWSPLGDNSAQFSGYYNGGNHLIKNLSCNVSGTKNARAGVFAWMSTGTIENLGMINPDVQANYQGGAIAGHIGSSTAAIIRNCFAIGGKVSTVNNNAGAILGESYDATLNDLFQYGTAITAQDYTGGVVGYTGANTQRVCSVPGKITGKTPGGFAGTASENKLINTYWCNDNGAGVSYIAGTISKTTGSFSRSGLGNSGTFPNLLNNSAWKMGRVQFSDPQGEYDGQAPVLASFDETAFYAPYQTNPSNSL